MAGSTENLTNAWLPTYEAVRHFVRRTGDVAAAERELATRVQNGLIDMKAEQISYTTDLGEIDWRRPIRGNPNPMIIHYYGFPDDEYDTSVHQSIWQRSVLAKSDMYRSEWGPGNFVVTIENKRRHPKRRIQIWGARLRQSQVFAEAAKVEAAPKVVARARRDASRIYDFTPAMTDLLMIGVAGKFLDKFAFENWGHQANLERWFLQWFRDRFDEEPSEGHVRRFVDPIVEAYHARGKSVDSSMSGRAI